MYFSVKQCNAHFIPNSADEGSILCAWSSQCYAGVGGTTCCEEVHTSPPSPCHLSPWDVLAICPQIDDIRTKSMASDEDNDGLINSTELGHFMRSEGMHPTETELSIMMSELSYGSQGITLNEFLRMMATEVGTTPEGNETNETTFWSEFMCAAGEEVPCPVSGEMCAGDMCCPGVQATGGLPFPCPSAKSTFCKCSNRTKLQDCGAVAETEVACSGPCDDEYCADLAFSYGGWPQACAGAGGSCDGCEGCCASRTPQGGYV